MHTYMFLSSGPEPGILEKETQTQTTTRISFPLTDNSEHRGAGNITDRINLIPELQTVEDFNQ